MSSSRRLVTWVARQHHHGSHVLFSRPCQRCGKVFDYCGCQPGRRYCCEECSEGARRQSKRRARAKYNARDTEEGREAHRVEEAARRALRAQGRVGDQCCGKEAVGLRRTIEPNEVSNAAAITKSAVVVEEPVEWLVVAWPEVLGVAQERLDHEARCPYCGRRGQVVQVVSVAEWRRQIRYGFLG